MNLQHSAFYVGEVMHHRMRPVRHRFIYRVSAMLIDLDELPALGRLRGFSCDTFNLFSFHQKDHGDGSDTPLKTQIHQLLHQHGVDLQQGPIRLLCYPRVLGYVFNPLSVFYCYDPKGELGAILYEVSNTFAQRRGYLIPVTPAHQRTPIRQHCNKDFYVSPFMPMETRYQFRMQPPEERVAVLIRQCDDEGVVLNATFTGRRVALSNRTLITTWLRHPLMTLKVIAGIHWEALQLWRKGLPLQPRPPQPGYRVSLINSDGVSQS